MSTDTITHPFLSLGESTGDGVSDRRADVDSKMGLVGALLSEIGCDGLLLLEPQNFSWLTCGARQRVGAQPRGLDLEAPLVPLSVPEARRLLEVALPLPVRSPMARHAWSVWRRHHQAIARRCHYRRRPSGHDPPK